MMSGLQTIESVTLAASEAVRKAAASLLKKQTSEGFWWADLRADSTLESDFILMELWLHPPVDGVWNPPTRPQIDRAVPPFWPGSCPTAASTFICKGPSEINASIKAYFALKLAGLSPEDERMRRLRERILRTRRPARRQ